MDEHADQTEAVNSTGQKGPQEGAENGGPAPSPIVGAYVFKDWWTAVWLRGAKVEMPERCACCGSERDLASETCKPVGESSADPVDYPICSFCGRHARADQRIVGISIIVGAIVPPVIYIACFGLAIPRRLGLGTAALGMLVLIIATAGAVYMFLSKRNVKGHDCAESGWPVEAETDPGEPPLLGEKNERTDEKQARLLSRELQQRAGKKAIGLRFRHPQYACDFIRKNGGNAEDLQRIEPAI